MERRVMEPGEVLKIDLGGGQGRFSVEDLAARLDGEAVFSVKGRVFGREELLGLAALAKGRGCSLALECRAASLTGLEDWRPLAEAGLKMVTWQGGAEVSAKPLASLFRAAGKAGIWNRVLLPARSKGEEPGSLEKFVAANPNLAHSWARSGGDGPEPSVYRRVPPLPGKPRWRVLQGLAGILAALAETDLKTLARQRAHEDGSLYELGKDLDFRFDPPEELPGELMETACLMVEEGGAVASDLVRSNLNGAFVIAHCHEEGALIGVSCLKRPRPGYLEHVAKMTGYDLTGAVERGYTSVRPEYRGLGVGTRLLEGETSLARERGVPVYSILGVENIGAQAMAKRNGSRLVCEYHSEKAGKDLGLWLPDWVDGLVKGPRGEKAGEK